MCLRVCNWCPCGHSGVILARPQCESANLPQLHLLNHSSKDPSDEGARL